MGAIFMKELKSYFYSPIAYVLIGFFIVITSVFFVPNLTLQSGEFNSNIANMGYMLIFIVPILTMRILAEERKNGTDVMLITSPVSLTSIVLGKYFSAFAVFIVLTVVSFIYPLVLVSFGAKVTAQMIGGYVGFILLGGSFIAVGLFASSLTENQIISAVIGFVSLLIMWIASGIAGMVGGFTGRILMWFSLMSRYEDFNRGIISLSPIVYYISFISLFLFITGLMIEKRRWSQG